MNSTSKLFRHDSLKAHVDFTNKRIYFWEGPFSQWSRETGMDGLYDPDIPFRASCAEQLMMIHKAILFGDTAAAIEISRAEHPRDMKAIGRRIKGFDETLWVEKRLEIVTRISYLKFAGSIFSPKQTLIMTDGFELVEASPEDKIWGVGLAATDPRILDKSQWQGLNLLGQALMAARQRIIEELPPLPTPEEKEAAFLQTPATL